MECGLNCVCSIKKVPVYCSSNGAMQCRSLKVQVGCLACKQNGGDNLDADQNHVADTLVLAAVGLPFR